MVDFGAIQSDTAVIRDIVIPTETIGMGAIAPTAADIGTTPTVPALHFSATSEIAGVQVVMPIEWDNGDITLQLTWALSATETNGDTLDITVDYVATIIGTTGAGPAKTSTQVTGQVTVTTGAGLAIGDLYRMEVAIPAADGTNPLANAQFLAIEWHLTNTDEVGEADLVGAHVQYTALY